jgi:hypothetical protein
MTCFPTKASIPNGRQKANLNVFEPAEARGDNRLKDSLPVQTAHLTTGTTIREVWLAE